MFQKNLQILYFAPCGLFEGIGGSARLKDMIQVLQNIDIKIKLISYISGSSFEIKHEKVNENLDIVSIVILKSASKLLKAIAIPMIILYGLINKKNSQIILSHSPSIVSGLPAVIISMFFNKPLIIDHMDVKDPDTPKIIYDKILRKSTLIFAISHYLENNVKSNFHSNVLYVPIFTNPNIFKKDALERRNIRNKLGITNEQILIGYTGSFWYVEGVPFLLEAFKNLIKKRKNVKLILIGGKNVPDSDNITMLIDKLSINSSTIVIPPQPHDKIPTYLSACDILCSPKIDCEINRAANPVKVVEYLSMGLPTVCSAVGGIIDIIKDGFNGLLVEPGNIKDLEEKFEWIISDSTRAKKLGENGRKTVIEQYSYNSVEKIIMNSINELLKNNTRE